LLIFYRQFVDKPTETGPLLAVKVCGTLDVDLLRLIQSGAAGDRGTRSLPYTEEPMNTFAMSVDRIGGGVFWLLRQSILLICAILVIALYRYWEDSLSFQSVATDPKTADVTFIQVDDPGNMPVGNFLLDGVADAVAGVRAFVAGPSPQDGLVEGSGIKFLSEQEYNYWRDHLDELASAPFMQYDEFHDEYATDSLAQKLRSLSGQIASFKRNIACPTNGMKVEEVEGMVKMSCLISLRSDPPSLLHSYTV
jgi:hypothetical protein